MNKSNDEDSKKVLSASDLLAIEKSILANERTLLAYIRTSLSFYAAGISFIKFFHNPATKILGYAFIPVGITLFLLGFRRYVKSKRAIYNIIQR